MEEGRKVLLIGLGGLGSVVLELLARSGGVAEIVAAGRDAARGAARCNLARLGALAEGSQTHIRFRELDLDRPESLYQALRSERPDLILSTASMATWRLPDMLPPDAARHLKAAGFGPWLPVHLSLTLKLMRALREADYRGPVVAASFPDVVHCVLERLGLAPTCGVGNLAEIVPKVRHLAAERLDLSIGEVRVFLVAHHALEPYVFEGLPGPRPPFYLRVEAGGRDVTSLVEAQALLFTRYPIPSGEATHFLTAGCVVRLVRALLSDGQELLHAPGPQGLPGGYPVLAGAGRVELALPADLSQDQAVAINVRSHVFDGIEAVLQDGSVVFQQEAADRLERELGYRCPLLRPEEVEDRARELLARFQAYARRHGVELTL